VTQSFWSPVQRQGHALQYDRFFFLLPDDCQRQKAEDSDTSDVQSVPVQTVLLLSCADFKSRAHTTGYSRQGRYSQVPSVTEGQREYLFSNL